MISICLSVDVMGEAADQKLPPFVPFAFVDLGALVDFCFEALLDLGAVVGDDEVGGGEVGPSKPTLDCKFRRLKGPRR